MIAISYLPNTFGRRRVRDMQRLQVVRSTGSMPGFSRRVEGAIPFLHGSQGCATYIQALHDQPFQGAAGHRLVEFQRDRPRFSAV